MRTALLRTVSHDLRSPLAAATAAISGLRSQDMQLAAADRDELLDIAEKSLELVSRLAASLLDLTRLQAGGGLTMIMSVPAAPGPAPPPGTAWWPASPSPDRRELPDDNDCRYTS
jgi:two-component system sensor histidine kinase KdpD